MQSDLAKAKAALDKAKAAFERSVVASHEAGLSYRKIGAEVGLSHERVRQIVAGAKPAEPTVEQMRTRLAELDGRWDALVDRYAGSDAPLDRWDRAEQAARNKRARKLARRGLPNLTVRQERRTRAESEILDVLENRPDDPGVKAVVAELVEARRLRETLSPFADNDVPF